MMNRNPRSTLATLCVLACLLVVLAGCTVPVNVTWKTETELNTAGFNLYRGESPDGPFDVKVNTELIPPADDPLTGKAYTYIDRTAQAGRTYYYQLQEVEKSGQTNTHGPISVHVSGLTWWHAAILVALAGMVLALWLRGGRRAAQPR